MTPFRPKRFVLGLDNGSVYKGFRFRFLGDRVTLLRTVGGGLGLPSESSTLVLVRFDIWSKIRARSRRNFWI